ncbi:LOW QUALITY PROTEIN: uncharacterized protein ec [Atheta coriaria]|uniref:LOW QUALITY PROTEIN: uncharacterized protein ec n=1 Tax=Dalotia coriaria TaxID=877792 RepID=UPI0031F3C1B2
MSVKLVGGGASPSPHPSPQCPSRDSMIFTSTKGLLNAPGQNNCFLNSAVQVLWHLDIFRRSFRDLSGHACMAESCIFCALKELFSQLQFSHETALPPDALRRALAESFFDQQRFQLGFMDDAAECFENMLMRIHTHIAHGESEDMCNVRHCIPHQKFAMTLVEQSICEACGGSSEPLSFTQMVHYISASALTTQVRASVSNQNIGIQDSFGNLLKKAGNMGDIRDCPSSCGAKIQIRRSLMNHPEIVSIGIVWDSERPTLEHIMDVFATVGTTLRLADVFHSVVDQRWSDLTAHNLVGVVTYYGKHYSTFFFHTKLRVWIYFDDATVREVGPRWEQVVEKCRRGRYQPLLLLYAVPGGSPVSTENAPKVITPFYEKKTTLRRSVTPSPEKAPMVNMHGARRAITPNPDGKPPLPRNLNSSYNEYQNLAVIQDSIHFKPQVNIHRSLSSSSSTTNDGINIPDHLNVPRRRDSGNWSGDRNSASSSSSTTMENPYLYLVGKLPQNGSLPGSPTRGKDSTGSVFNDPGYDSYSLSSNDSSTMSTIQHLMKMGHLAKIPEDYNMMSACGQTPNLPMPNCDVLCDEADELLTKSRQLEDEHDLVLALALCNAAATKARAAMNAPYNNPQTLTLARMKHNTCIMRARSLHRRMTQTLNPPKENPIEIRHTREGSSGSARHSRQNSRDKLSRQNSKELLNIPVVSVEKPTKSIEIYATLPKKTKKMSVTTIEDAEYMIYDKPKERESRSIFSRSRKDKEAIKIKEKRSRSEDRNKIFSKDFSLAPDKRHTKKSKETKEKEEKEEKKEKKGKQHKIRRKLLMGGLIRRKNRSMPDLTEVADQKDQNPPPITSSVDDSTIGTKQDPPPSMSGYLSEGHLEFTGNSCTNPNLERSRLMRKSFHGSAGKVLTVAKVPPPPPLRTTSQLSKIGLKYEDEIQLKIKQEENVYCNFDINANGRASLSPYERHQTVITHADVHQEQSPVKDAIDSGVDEVDCCPSVPVLELPPYPSPPGSVLHSRQPSEEFPPPPTELDLIEDKPGLLQQLQNKRMEILNGSLQQQQQQQQNHVGVVKEQSGDVWLKELQAKQAALRKKLDPGVDEVNTQRVVLYPQMAEAKTEAKITSVKDLASRFEQDKFELFKNETPGVLSLKKRDDDVITAQNTIVQHQIPQELIQQEIKEVEMLTAQVQKTFHPEFMHDEDQRSHHRQKKKSVSFCDQVILVATAEEQEDDSYIPNPILERVLRTAIHKPEAQAIRQEIISLRENELRKENELKVRQEEEEVMKNYESKRFTQNGVESVVESPYGGRPAGMQTSLSREEREFIMNNSKELAVQQQPQQQVYHQQPQQSQQHQQVYQSLPQNAYGSPNYIPASQLSSTPPQNVVYPPYQSPPQVQMQNGGYNTTPTSSHSVYQSPPVQFQGQSQGQNRPYQMVPPNSQMHPQMQNYQAYYRPPQMVKAQSPAAGNHDLYSSSPRSYPLQQVRQSPTPGVYYHPPSPSPSTQSSYTSTSTTNSPVYRPYQRVPPLPMHEYHEQSSPYQRVPNTAYHQQQTQQQHQMNQDAQYVQRNAYHQSPYQHVPVPVQNGHQYIQNGGAKQILKKSVSFEPGTKGEDQLNQHIQQQHTLQAQPKAIVTPILVNNNVNNSSNNHTKCNLCRKKAVPSANIYCTDCEYYMSRFKPKS